MKNHHIKIVVLLLLTAFAYIPFSGKALHIDDPLFYHTAKQVIRNPLDPYSYEIVWFGKKERLFDFFSNPPLLGYYIALIINFLGEGERTLHISLLLFTIISALSMYFLSIRFISMPLVSALFFIFSPICMVMGQTLMPDMALAAFFLLSITLFIHGYDKNNPLFLLISGISAAIAVLTRYNGISIIPLITLYYLLYFDKKKKWGVAVIIFPIISILLWNIYTLEIYGKMHLLSQLKFQSYGSRLSITKILIHLLPHIAYLGGGTIFPLLFFVPFFSGIRKKPVFLSILLLGTVCCVYIPLRKFTHYNLINFSLGVLF
ncbi:glycosyltransferase family 39 protein, partial [bacterium]|nr:glycosyltransferase family 39 protein [bacterium]